jgi:hypothetical protein
VYVVGVHGRCRFPSVVKSRGMGDDSTGMMYLLPWWSVKHREGRAVVSAGRKLRLQSRGACDQLLAHAI